MDVFAGVDCHKDSHAIIFVAENGRVIRELSIAADPAASRLLAPVIALPESFGSGD